MITVHHIVNSRSQRILWMLEELRLDYELVTHPRDPATMLAPETLKVAHPLGKAPSVEIDGKPMAESGAILELLVEREGRLMIPPGHPARADYLYWLHFAEGSFMPVFVLAMRAKLLGEPAQQLATYASGELDRRLAHMDAAVSGHDFLAGETFTAADAHNGYNLDVAAQYGRLAAYTNLVRYREALRARPAYLHAARKGGPFTLGQGA